MNQPAPQVRRPWALALLPFQSLAACFLLNGCASSKPPPAPPPALAQAHQAAARAQRYSTQANWSAAARQWQSAADRFRLLNDLSSLGTALNRLGHAEMQLRQWSEAMTHLLQAATLHQQLGNQTQWWQDQIGLLQVEAKSHNQEALGRRLEELQLQAAELDDPRTRALFLNELALWQMSQHQTGQAATNFDKAQVDFRLIGDQLGLATVTANRAQLQEANGDWPAALSSWRAALAAFEKLADPEGIAFALAGTGRTLFKSGQDLPQAETLLRRAADNYRALGQPEQAESTLETLRQWSVSGDR